MPTASRARGPPISRPSGGRASTCWTKSAAAPAPASWTSAAETAGCLEQAQARGAQAVGITISEEQVARCRQRQLDARLLNYRNLPPDWDGAFDGLVANGSLEHFVSVDDAAAGRDGPLYEEFFAICRRLVSAGCRLATTAIHFRQSGQVRPEEMQRGPYAFDRTDPRYHFAMVLERTFGGWYPARANWSRAPAASSAWSARWTGRGTTT